MPIASAKDAQWHLAPKDRVHEVLAGVFESVRQDGEWGVTTDAYHLDLYWPGSEGAVRGSSRRGFVYEPMAVPYNVCRSAADTMTAKIGKAKPLPQVLASSSDWKGRRKAKKLTQFIDGCFYETRFFERTAPLIVRDATITRYGAVHVFEDGTKIRCERVYSWELFVDEWDAHYGDPRSMYRCRTMDRGVVKSRFAGKSSTLKAAIDSAGRFGALASELAGDSHTVDRVDVVEAWYLPSAEGAKDGRHVIIVEGATLLDEPWEQDTFPIYQLHYNPPVVGAHGQSLVSQLEGYQQELCMVSEKLSEQFYKSGVGIITYDGSGIEPEYLRNGITHIPCKPGMRPEVFQMDLVSEHMLQRPRQLTQDALNDAGLSQMSVQAQKPKGIQAAAALQTLDDIETERFVIFGKQYRSFCLDVARGMIECAKRIAAKHGEYAVRVPMRSGFVELSWADVEIDGYELKAFPTSGEQDGPAQRKSTLWELFNGAAITREQFIRNLDLPDLQGEFEIEMAPYLLTDEKLDFMLDTDPDEHDPDERYMPPEPYEQVFPDAETGKPGWAKQRALMKRDRAKMDGAPEEVLLLLERYIRDIDELVARTQSPAPAPPPQPPVGAGAGGPMPPPELSGGPPMNPAEQSL